MYYRICPDCGVHLDAGERCNCHERKNETAPLQRERPQAKYHISSLSGNRLEVKAKGRRFYG